MLPADKISAAKKMPLDTISEKNNNILQTKKSATKYPRDKLFDRQQKMSKKISADLSSQFLKQHDIKLNEKYFGLRFIPKSVLYPGTFPCIFPRL